MRLIVVAIDNPSCAPRKRDALFAVFVLLWVVIFWTWEPNPAIAAGTMAQQSELVSRQLIVLFDPTNADAPSAPSIVDAANTSAHNPTLNIQLGSPVGGNWPMEGLTSPTLRIELAKNPRSPRARLENYVVLTYADTTTAAVARGILRNDPRILSVGSNLPLSYASTIPNDPYFSLNANHPYPGDYQWGMQLLNLPKAWDLVKGTAYVGAVDHGIYCSSIGIGGVCTPHDDLQQNFRQQFSKNMSGGAVDELTGENNLYAGHGTHVAGIIAATSQNGVGVAGTCFMCSLAIIKRPLDGTDYTAVAFAVDSGMQVINYSLTDESRNANTTPPWYDTTRVCDATHNVDYFPMCDAIAHAKANDVVFVAASGNFLRNRIGFPALDQDTIAVGGVKYGGYLWDDGKYFSYCDPSNPHTGPECGSNWGNQQNVATLQSGSLQIVAPAMNVVSTFYLNHEWNDNVYCHDTWGQTSTTGDPTSGVLDSKYGDCRGTSMAAPHATGIVGLMRSANPLLSRDQVKSILLSANNTISCVNSDSRCGAGIPDAAKAVSAALGGSIVVNRLTPFFSFYSADRGDHLYTTVPQMGSAAILGSLLPVSYTGNQKTYGSIGPTVSAYPWFLGVPTTICGVNPPCDAFYPRAMLSVFTTFKNPIPGGADLIPLYRYSRPCPSATDSKCSNNHEHVSHVYAADTGEQWLQAGYLIDGIEGYIYPKSATQHPGAVKVCRKYYYQDVNSIVHDDYILFPGAGANGDNCSASTDGYTLGGNNYTQNVYNDDWIGWAYTARAPQAMYAIGFLWPLIGVDD